MSPLHRLAGLLLAALLGLGPPAFAQSPDELKQIAAEFGGPYNDPGLQRYVTSVGELLSQASDRPGAARGFTVLDSDVVNAFAVPSGDVFVTRGLIALANSEAELASVLAHEIGHVTAQHAEHRQERGTYGALGALGAGLLGALIGAPQLGQLGQLGAQAWISKYSREQESEADLLGIRFMSRAGYDPRAAAWFLKSLEDQSALESKIAGAPRGDASYNFMSDHPRTADRVQQAIEAARGITVNDPMLARDVYLPKIDGIVWGDNPDGGIVRNRVFLHPKLKFGFEVPDGFRLLNGQSQVQAKGPDGAVIVFDRNPQPFRGGPDAYIARAWAAKAQLANLERFDINGMPAATATTRAQIESVGTVDVRFVAIAWSEDTFYRFLFISPPNATARLTPAFERTARSLHRLSDSEAASIRPLRVRVVTARQGDTVESLARAMPVDRLQKEQLTVLNGMPADYQLKPGDKVKVISER
jgi:predicted Zn-dependent protease